LFLLDKLIKYLGAGTALLGKEAAMACTVAVETVISEHYNKWENVEYVRFFLVEFCYSIVNYVI